MQKGSWKTRSHFQWRPGQFTATIKPCPAVCGLANVLDDEKQQQIRALGRLGWTLSALSRPICDQRKE